MTSDDRLQVEALLVKGLLTEGEIAHHTGDDRAG
jgi:hypothetical protein